MSNPESRGRSVAGNPGAICAASASQAVHFTKSQAEGEQFELGSSQNMEMPLWRSSTPPYTQGHVLHGAPSSPLPVHAVSGSQEGNETNVARPSPTSRAAGSSTQAPVRISARRGIQVERETLEHRWMPDARGPHYALHDGEFLRAAGTMEEQAHGIHCTDNGKTAETWERDNVLPQDIVHFHCTVEAKVDVAFDETYCGGEIAKVFRELGVCRRVAREVRPWQQNIWDGQLAHLAEHNTAERRRAPEAVVFVEGAYSTSTHPVLTRGGEGASADPEHRRPQADTAPAEQHEDGQEFDEETLKLLEPIRGIGEINTDVQGCTPGSSELGVEELKAPFV
ncbi:hypothetical protein DFH06DRAFT_1144037 [Mycena polygramma]|nr:hypothetical protein DFH06DRAFT_1144037 [Mycena polygramma]